MTVAPILDAERERQGQSINALARAAGMQPSQCLRVLNGETINPGFVTVQALLSALGKSLTWLDRQMKRPG